MSDDGWEIAQEFEGKLVRISELLDHYQNCMESIGGCGDGNCVIIKPEGMHTNGGCRCFERRIEMRRYTTQTRYTINEIQKILEE